MSPLLRHLRYLPLAAALAACTVLPVRQPSSPGSAVQQIRSELAAGRHQEALSLIQRQVRGGKAESAFAREYPSALHGVLAAADRHRRAQRYLPAGELLRQALEAWPKDPAVIARLDRNRTKVEEERRSCADRLMDLGLVEYRGGRLEDAIAHWQQALAVEPGHPAARQAVETAAVQLKNLRSLRE